jgi:hypothetical protein
MISHNHKAIFVHVPKVAGTSMRVCFRKNGFQSTEYHAPDGTNDDKTGVYINGTSWRIRRNLLDVWDDYFKFAFVRNPWDRLVSCWKNRAGRYIKFESFLNDYPYPNHNHNLIWHTLPQFTHISDIDGNNMMNFVGRFENLKEDMEYICNKLKIKNKELPHINVSNHEHYRSYYDNDEQINFVYNLYKKEIDMFNYTF